MSTGCDITPLVNMYRCCTSSFFTETCVRFRYLFEVKSLASMAVQFTFLFLGGTLVLALRFAAMLTRGGSAALIEWGDTIEAGLPEDRLVVHFEVMGDERLLRFVPYGAWRDRDLGVLV